MAKVAGNKGYVTIGSAIAGINQWSLDYTTEMLETTDFAASGVATYLPGVSRWNGTFSGFKDGAPQAIAGASVTLVLGENAGTNWQGVAYISGIHPTNNFDGLVGYAYDFQGDGALTVATS